MTISSLMTKGFAAAWLLCLASACTTLDPERTALAQAAPDVTWISAFQTKDRSATWRHRAFPGKKRTDYHATLHEGRQAVRSESSAAASMLRETVWSKLPIWAGFLFHGRCQPSSLVPT